MSRSLRLMLVAGAAAAAFTATASASEPTLVPGWPASGGNQVAVTKDGSVLTLQNRRLDKRTPGGALVWRVVAPAEVGDGPRLSIGPGGEVVVGGDDMGVVVTKSGRIGRSLERCPSPVFGPDGTRISAVPFRYIEACDGAGNVKWGLRWGASGLSKIGAIDPSLVPSPDVDSVLARAQIAVGPDSTVYLGVPAGVTRSIPRKTTVGKILAVSGTDGSTKWSKDLVGSPGWIGLAPDGTLMVEDRGGAALRGLTATGTERFALPIDGLMFGAAVGNDGLTYVMDGAYAGFGFNGSVFGQLPGRRRLRALLTDGTVTVSRVLAEDGDRLLGLGPDGTVYISHSGGSEFQPSGLPQLRALNPDARDRWATTIWSAEALGAPAARKDGSIVIGDLTSVYAFGPKLVPVAPTISKANLSARAGTFRLDGPPQFCATKIKKRCVRQAPPLGTILRLDLPAPATVQFSVRRLDTKRRARVIREDPRYIPTYLPKGSNWIAFPECCLLRFFPDQQSPTLAPGRYRISAAGASTVVTIAPPPKGFKRGLYDS